MKRIKRKYIREALQSKSRPLKEESSINLPPDILKDIESMVSRRKELGLPDDREERIQRALRYQEFRNGKISR